MPFFFDHEGAFWSKVDRSAGETACWIWMRAVDSSGYGALKVRGRKLNAHRYSYELHYGTIPDGLDVCHRCNTRLCVNPAHLYVGTRKQNVADSIAAGTYHFLSGGGANQKGEKNPHATLTNEEVLEIYQRAWSGERLQKIADDYGIVKSVVVRIKHGERWAHITKHQDQRK